MDGRKQIYHQMLNLVANRLLIWVLDQFTGQKWRKLTTLHELIPVSGDSLP
jgi:hypothetical protein